MPVEHSGMSGADPLLFFVVIGLVVTTAYLIATAPPSGDE
jgi:hypothetical protein